MPDQVMDIPKLPQIFSITLIDLFKMGALNPKDIEWIAPEPEGEDEMVFVEIFYKLMARLLAQLHN